MKKAFFTSKEKMRGYVTKVLLDKNGKPKKMFKGNFLWKFIFKVFGKDVKSIFTGYWTIKPIICNTITTKGKEVTAARLGGISGYDAANYIAIGIGSGGTTALNSEITTGGGERGAGVGSVVTTTTTNDTLRLIKTFNFTASFAVIEEGVFDASSTGNMVAYQSFSAVSVENGDTFQITHNIKLA